MTHWVGTMDPTRQLYPTGHWVWLLEVAWHTHCWWGGASGIEGALGGAEHGYAGPGQAVGPQQAEGPAAGGGAGVQALGAEEPAGQYIPLASPVQAL